MKLKEYFVHIGVEGDRPGVRSVPTTPGGTRPQQRDLLTGPLSEAVPPGGTPTSTKPTEVTLSECDSLRLDECIDSN